MAKFVAFLALLISANCVAFTPDIAGIWIGEAPGRNAEKQDVAFQFKNVNGVLSGLMFGEEFDVSLEDLKVEGDTVSFSVTTVNYYSGNRLTMTYTGTVSEQELQLTRQRKNPPANPPADDQLNRKQTLILKRVTPLARSQP